MPRYSTDEDCSDEIEQPDPPADSAEEKAPSYYYDDAHGYQNFDPERDEEDDAEVISSDAH